MSLFQFRAFLSQLSGGEPDELQRFSSFEALLFQFLSSTRFFQDSANNRLDIIRSQLISFTIAHVAVIQLHNRLDNSTSNRHRLDAAKAVARALDRIPNLGQWKHVDPIMGVSEVKLFYTI